MAETHPKSCSLLQAHPLQTPSDIGGPDDAHCWGEALAPQGPWQGEGKDVVAEGRAELAMASYRDEHVLRAVDLVGHGGRLRTSRQRELPQQRARLNIE